MGCGASKKAVDPAKPAAPTGEYEGMTAEGQPVQHFDLERDAEESVEADQETKAVKAKEFAKTMSGNMARNMTLSAVTGAPGIVFGVGSAVGKKASSALLERAQKEEGALLTVSAVRVSALYDLGDDKRKMSPFVRARLLMDGVESDKMGPIADKFRGKTAKFANGGPDIVYPEGKHTTTFALPMKEAEKAKNACLLLAVEDAPEVSIGKAFREVCVGTAIVALGQLVDALAEHEEVSAPVNLVLLRGDGYTDFAGSLRVTVGVKLT